MLSRSAAEAFTFTQEFIYGTRKKDVTMLFGGESISLPQLKDKDMPRGATFVMNDHGLARRIHVLARKKRVINAGAALLHIDEHDDLALKLPLNPTPETLDGIL